MAASRGRPTKLSHGAAARLGMVLGAGGTLEVAAATLGVSRRTVRRWLTADRELAAAIAEARAQAAMLNDWGLASGSPLLLPSLDLLLEGDWRLE